MDPNIELDNLNKEAPNEVLASYATRIGSLMYLAHGTRANTAYATQKLAQYMKKPSQDTGQLPLGLRTAHLAHAHERHHRLEHTLHAPSPMLTRPRPRQITNARQQADNHHLREI